MEDIVVVRVLEEDEEPPRDAVAMPAREDMEPEAAVRRLIDVWGLSEADARFHLAVARGEIEGDIIAVQETSAHRTARQRDRNSA